MKLTFLGHSALIVEEGTFKGIIDPFITGNFTMDIDDAVKASDLIKAKAVVPIHYNTFGLIKADPLEFKNKVKSSETVILGMNESINI